MRNYGIQVYSLRDMAKTNMDGALCAVAEMGYKKIELGRYDNYTAEEIRKLADKYNLEVVGSHCALWDLVNNFNETVKYHKTLGNKNYILPCHDLSTIKKIDEFAEACRDVIPKLHAEGMELGYHNHRWEFMDTEEGFQIQNELVKRCDIFFELDTYWAFVGGQDPVETMTRLRDRIKWIHLKDGVKDGSKGCSLGEGEAPVKAVHDKAVEYGFEIIVESEGLCPTGKEEVERCMNFLKTLN